MLELSDQELKIIMITMLMGIIDNVGSMYKQRDNLWGSRDRNPKKETKINAIDQKLCNKNEEHLCWTYK